MKYYIIAGEASGDLHASNLVKAIKKKDSSALFRGWGGDLMSKAGVNIVKHYRDLSFMGFIEVILNIRIILANLKFCKQDINTFEPNRLILVDYPGFNLRIATYAKKKKIPVHYYISPQIWAWKESRVHRIKRDVTKMYVILPFEKKFYKEKYNLFVHFVGHPLIDLIAQRKIIDSNYFREQNGLSPTKPIIALLPGSRKQEISTMLKIMLTQITNFPEYEFVIAGAPGQDESFYKPFILNKSVKFVINKTYDLLSTSSAALVTSGTATLETALFKVPQVVCYKTSTIQYYLAKILIKLKYISLVNLIMSKKVVPELIQNNFNTRDLNRALKDILTVKKELILKDYNDLNKKLEGVGASEKTAELIIKG